MTIKDYKNFCSNCILPNGFLEITLDDDGICNFCRDSTYQIESWKKVPITEEMKKNALNDWNKTISTIQTLTNKRKYDCILGYSGGKDSTALLDMLINDLGLNVLALTINTGFMTDIAKKNIEQTLKKLNYEKHHLFIQDAASTFIKLYKFLFLNHNLNNLILTGTVCDHCSDLIHSIMTKEAIRRNIPLIVLGYSSDQIKRYFYEISETEIRSEWTPDFIDYVLFTKGDREWFLNYEEKNIKNLPRILLPYHHVLDYDENKVIQKVTSQGLIEQGKTDPILTNCHVVKTALMYDLYRYGGLPYVLQYAELIRQEKEQKRPRTRKKWLRLYKTISKTILDGEFTKSEIKNFLSQINVSKEELLSKINAELEQDPHRSLIKTNLEKLR